MTEGVSDDQYGLAGAAGLPATLVRPPAFGERERLAQHRLEAAAVDEPGEIRQLGAVRPDDEEHRLYAVPVTRRADAAPDHLTPQEAKVARIWPRNFRHRGVEWVVAVVSR